jgi:hypothetical protein
MTFRIISRLLLSLTLAFAPLLVHAQGHEHASCRGPITSAGERLSDTQDSMNVETLWLVHSP